MALVVELVQFKPYEKTPTGANEFQIALENRLIT